MALTSDSAARLRGTVWVSQVSTDIIHFQSKKLQYYKGDYDTFVNVRAEAAKNQRRAYEASMAKKQHMQEFIDKFRSNAKRASLVQSRIKVSAPPRVSPGVRVPDGQRHRAWRAFATRHNEVKLRRCTRCRVQLPLGMLGYWRSGIMAGI